MAYPEFPFPKHLPSFMRREEVNKYLEDYALHFDLMKHIRLEHEVVSVKPKYDINDEPAWEILVKNARNDTSHTTVFDAVVVCNGHFEVPRRPEIPGLDRFPGTVIHSFNYDKPEDYKGRVVAILGAKSSGVDISMDLSKFAAKIYLIHLKLKEKGCTKYPENVEEIVGTITACFSDGYVEINNNQRCHVDSVILCTGYLYSFPFLDPECGINVSHNHVTPLYKHVFNIRHPTMSFVGICLRVCPFPNFALQAKWICSVLTGRKALPSKEEMLRDAQSDYQQRLEAGMTKNAMHALGTDYQLLYSKDIANLAGVSCSYTPVMHSLYCHVNAIRTPNLATYKSKNFDIEDDEWQEIY